MKNRQPHHIAKTALAFYSKVNLPSRKNVQTVVVLSQIGDFPTPIGGGIILGEMS